MSEIHGIIYILSVNLRTNKLENGINRLKIGTENIEILIKKYQCILHARISNLHEWNFLLKCPSKRQYTHYCICQKTNSYEYSDIYLAFHYARRLLSRNEQNIFLN
jgi:hypothetical protein